MPYFLRYILLLVLSILLGVIATLTTATIITRQNNPPHNLASPIPESPKIPQFSIETPPSQSLTGAIISLSGKVEWQSRVATQSSTINTPQSLHQGEKIITEDDGEAIFSFSKALEADMSPKSELDFIQTLPANIVMEQNSGTIHYTKTGQTPISIRSLHILIDITEGNSTITVNKDDNTITIDVKKGSAKAAFNNLQLISKVITIKEGNQLIYNDKTRRTTLNP